MITVSHEIRILKRLSHNFRRRCWTEICRKVDGRKTEDPKDKLQKPKEDNPKVLLQYPYQSTCFQLFLLQDDTESRK